MPDTDITQNISTDLVVTLRIKREVVKLIDKERSRFSAPRSSWITQAVVEKLEKLGYEIK